MKKLSAHRTLRYVIELLTYYLEELENVGDTANEQFSYGAKTAYAECLEAIQLWEKASENGLDYNIEDRFPL